MLQYTPENLNDFIQACLWLMIHQIYVHDPTCAVCVVLLFQGTALE